LAGSAKNHRAFLRLLNLEFWLWKNFIINQRFGFSFSAGKFSISLLFRLVLFSPLA
jgi:hypothetical protein